MLLDDFNVDCDTRAHSTLSLPLTEAAYMSLHSLLKVTRNSATAETTRDADVGATA